MKIDLHMHSTVSDGQYDAKELFNQVQEAGISVFSLTDHDKSSGLEEMRALADAAGIRFINGIEFSCLIDTEDRDSDCHILGYGFDPGNDAIRELQQRGLEYRKKKLDDMLDYLFETHKIVLSDDALLRLRSLENFGKPMLAKELIDGGFCTSEQVWTKEHLDGFKTLLHPGAEETIRVIHEAGGVAIWAHPMDDKRNKAERKSEAQFLTQFEQMKAFGIDGLECCYALYDEEEIDFLIQVAKENGFHITGGSDYHGPEKKTNKLGQTGIEISHSDRIEQFVNWIFDRC